MTKSDCAPSEDSDQPGHPPSRIRVFSVHMKKHWVLSYPLRTMRRPGKCQADLSLHWVHIPFCWVLSWGSSFIRTWVFPWYILFIFFIFVYSIHIINSSSCISINNQLKPYTSIHVKSLRFEPQHDKTNKMTVHPVTTPISLDIHPVWSESSLCAQWVAKDPSFLHADSEDSNQTGQMPRLICLLDAHSSCWFCHVVAHIFYSDSFTVIFITWMVSVVSLRQDIFLQEFSPLKPNGINASCISLVSGKVY